MSVLEDIKSAWKKIAYVFSKEYKENVKQYVLLQKNASKIKLKDSGTDLDEVISVIEKNGIEPELNINVFSENEPNSQHQKYAESLIIEQSNCEYEGAKLHPLMPREYNAAKRAELKEIERKILTGSKDKNMEPNINIER